MGEGAQLPLWGSYTFWLKHWSDIMFCLGCGGWKYRHVSGQYHKGLSSGFYCGSGFCFQLVLLFGPKWSDLFHSLHFPLGVVQHNTHTHTYSSTIPVSEYDLIPGKDSEGEREKKKSPDRLICVHSGFHDSRPEG